jgi:hypothetical protein
MVVAMKPSEGKYACCAGPVKRGIAPMSPDFAISIYGETNAFWEIDFDKNAKKTVLNAKVKAKKDIEKAKKLLEKSSNKKSYSENLLALAKKEFSKGESENCKDIFSLAKAIRAFTRAQVRALQICEVF